LNRFLRYAVLTVVLALVVHLALGFGSRSFEAYCPFGGVESLWGLFTTGEFSCALGPLNLSFLVALLGLTLLCKKAFCGWVCPIGFLGDLAARASGWAWKHRPPVPPRLNRALKLLRYVVLAVSLFFTYRAGELVLRGYDPYFLIFSGFGHGSAGLLSVFVLAGILIGMAIIPMMFCRYLCPLGAVFDPFSRLGLLRISRDPAKCTGCGRCARACLHDIPVPTLRTVRHRDCTQCLECLNACPEKGALELRARGTLRLPPWALPVLASLALTAGYFLRIPLTRPTSVQTFAEGTGVTTAFVVDGLRCKGTAAFLTSRYEETPGILQIETFASERTAVFTYDPQRLNPSRIREIMEAPIPFEDGTTQQVFRCVSPR